MTELLIIGTVTGAIYVVYLLTENFRKWKRGEKGAGVCGCSCNPCTCNPCNCAKN